MQHTRLRLLITALILLVLLKVSVSPAVAQVFNLDAQTATKRVGEEFSVNISINTEGKPVAGADVKLNFDKDMLEIVDVTLGSFFSDTAKNIGEGTIYIAGFFRAQYETKTGTGMVATLKMKGKKVGTTPLSFVCTTKTNDTNILDGSAADIIVCANTKDGSYTFTEGGGGGGGTSPTSTPVPGASTAKPTVPVSGSTETTFIFIGAGLLLALFGAVFAFN